jgi:hypothetical protein
MIHRNERGESTIDNTKQKIGTINRKKFVPEPIAVSPYYSAALTTLYGGDTIKRN